MKLLKTYDNTGAHDGYFDHAKATSYRLYPWRKSTPGHVTTAFMVRVNLPCVDSDGDQVGAFLSPEFATREEAMAELDRIAALIEGTAPAPAQGWVEGPPPLTDGAWFLAVRQGDPVAIHCHAAHDLPWTDTAGNEYFSSELTHHLPTPIQPPKES